jgi:hypothetical protein
MYVLTISRPFLLRMRNISDKIPRENRNMLFMFNNFFSFENRAAYEITWKTVVEPGRPHVIKGACALRAGYLSLETHTQNM